MRRARGAGTSGGELEEESWQPPDSELIQKLVAQIEHYLSDENLEHDAFLLKHVRRNKMGFVSVKLLTSFKKVGSACTHSDAQLISAEVVGRILQNATVQQLVVPLNSAPGRCLGVSTTTTTSFLQDYRGSGTRTRTRRAVEASTRLTPAATQGERRSRDALHSLPETPDVTPRRRGAATGAEGGS
ncbi:hypothetical protein CRUP_011990 [Coryphaenoides rupestris]|nr:hypothetical protein CRUP_011990 [Coryphaenoides rupestris]